MSLVDYQLDGEGVMRVVGDTGSWYRYPDLTGMAEYMVGCVETCLHRDLKQEVAFFVRYDRAKAAIRARLDLPDRQLDLFIRLVFQGKGTLSQAKRAAHFAHLTDQEISDLVRLVGKQDTGVE